MWLRPPKSSESTTMINTTTLRKLYKGSLTIFFCYGRLLNRKVDQRFGNIDSTQMEYTEDFEVWNFQDEVSCAAEFERICTLLGGSVDVVPAS